MKRERWRCERGLLDVASVQSALSFASRSFLGNTVGSAGTNFILLVLIFQKRCDGGRRATLACDSLGERQWRGTSCRNINKAQNGLV